MIIISQQPLRSDNVNILLQKQLQYLDVSFQPKYEAQ